MSDLDGKPTFDWWADQMEHTARIDYPLTRDSMFIDVGGNGGDWSVTIAEKYDCHIWLFEPIPQFMAECKRRLEHNPKVKFFQYALSDHNGTAPISIHGVYSSLYKFYDDQTDVPLMDVAEAFAEVKHCTLMSVNCEGAEFVILPRMVETGIIDKFENIQIQFHELYPDAQKKRREVQELLLHTHQPTYNYQWVWENWKHR